jgi:hypothetical protein
MGALPNIEAVQINPCALHDAGLMLPVSRHAQLFDAALNAAGCERKNHSCKQPGRSILRLQSSGVCHYFLVGLKTAGSTPEIKRKGAAHEAYRRSKRRTSSRPSSMINALRLVREYPSCAAHLTRVSQIRSAISTTSSTVAPLGDVAGANGFQVQRNPCDLHTFSM